MNVGARNVFQRSHSYLRICWAQLRDGVCVCAGTPRRLMLIRPSPSAEDVRKYFCKRIWEGLRRWEESSALPCRGDRVEESRSPFVLRAAAKRARYVFMDQLVWCFICWLPLLNDQLQVVEHHEARPQTSVGSREKLK